MVRILLCFVLLVSGGVLMSSLPAEADLRDVYADTWVATDALGRSVSTHEQVGAPRKDKFVGIFYFLWLGAHGVGGPYDITKIISQNPDAMTNVTSPPWGPMERFHHWAEPLFGYYLTNDRWVLRKHADMLANAGVDTVIFDVTNQATYKENYLTLCEVWSQVRKEGGRTPQIAFLAPFGDPRGVVRQLYNDLYGKNLYSDLWFRWKGKPLIMADPERVEPELRDFFTYRKPQPSYFEGPTGPNCWGWLEVSPQHVFYNSEGKPEQMTVGVGQNGILPNRCAAFTEKGTHGRSWHDGKEDTTPGAVNYGLNVKEQWERALAVDPEFVFVTGWNEWVAMRFDEFNGVRQPPAFVDQFSQEYSRDIEPMKGGHSDSYYYQMVDYIRRFKGARPIPTAGPEKSIRMDGNFSDWKTVQPEYRDNIGDTMHRDHPGWGSAGQYINKTGRNDIVLAKVARDRKFIYFYAQTREPITSHTDANWMMLFLSTDGDSKSGWEGYNFIVNRKVIDHSTTLLEASTGGWNWESRGGVVYRVKGNELELAIPRAALGFDDPSRPIRLDFKWADNIQKPGDIMEFTVSGDAAPDGRFAYRFREK